MKQTKQILWVEILGTVYRLYWYKYLCVPPPLPPLGGRWIKFTFSPLKLPAKPACTAAIFYCLERNFPWQVGATSFCKLFLEYFVYLFYRMCLLLKMFLRDMTIKVLDLWFLGISIFKFLAQCGYIFVIWIRFSAFCFHYFCPENLEDFSRKLLVWSVLMKSFSSNFSMSGT